jgi:hypothetical protein
LREFEDPCGAVDIHAAKLRKIAVQLHTSGAVQHGVDTVGEGLELLFRQSKVGFAQIDRHNGQPLAQALIGPAPLTDDGERLLYPSDRFGLRPSQKCEGSTAPEQFGYKVNAEESGTPGDSPMHRNHSIRDRPANR